MTTIDNSMEGKTCLVTGATSGIGLVTAAALAQMGAHVVMVGRSETKLAAAVEHVKAQSGSSRVDTLLADLSLQAQVRGCAEEYRSRYDRLDVLVNNAGGFYLRRELSADGIEMTWALNHLAYFLLTNLLLDVIRASAPARIVNVASGSHVQGTINFADLEGNKRYRGWTAYRQSKLANILFTCELARRLEGSEVTANCLHPGFVATGIGQNNGPLSRLAMPVVGLFALSPEEGAQTSIYLASSPEVEGVTGKYFADSKPVSSSPESYDEGVARRLWEISLEMTGLDAE